MCMYICVYMSACVCSLPCLWMACIPRPRPFNPHHQHQHPHTSNKTGETFGIGAYLPFHAAVWGDTFLVLVADEEGNERPSSSSLSRQGKLVRVSCWWWFFVCICM